MNMKAFAIFIIIVAVIAGTLFFFRGSHKESTAPRDSTSLTVGKNAIYVADQAPSGSILVAVVRLEKSGFVVVHEDATGTPGKILGVSKALPTGETKNLGPIPLSRMTRDQETLYVMLHLDDGDGIFDVAKDKPALDSVSSEPVMMIITVSKDATEPGAVSL